ADCHSKPIYQLVREGYYPSFGKPHDGLGFVPQMMDHSHGSTAIAGVAIVSGDGFPEEYRGDAFTGNVMTSRINRDRLDRFGASVKAVEQPDFLSTTDPWFRPVDLQYGPDDALYVADFYNRIIGHYEVPLDHPGRDRTSGRIWRIVYRGKDASGSAKRLPNLSGLSNEELIGQLSSPNLTKRMLITDWLSDTVGQKAYPEVFASLSDSNAPEQLVHTLWILFRMEKTGELDWGGLLTHPSSLVRGHSAKILGQVEEFPPILRSALQSRLNESSPYVKREAAETLGNQAFDLISLKGLNEVWRNAETEGDPILRQTAKIAMRNLLRHDGALASLDLNSLDPEFASRVSEICLGLNSEASGEYLMGYLKRNPELVAESSQYVEHAVKTLPANRKAETISLIRTQLTDRVELQLTLFDSVMSGMGRNQALKSSEMAEWANALVESLNEIAMQGSHEWSTHPAPQSPRSAIPWGFQERQASDGKTIRVLSSFPNGEQLTGIVRSVAFAAPKKLSFYLCGHRGFPAQPPHDKNMVSLRDGAGNVLRTAFPPRNDVAQKIEWDLTEFEGKEVYFEAVDGDTGGAYAWLAFGRFEPPVIELPSHSPEELSHFVTWIANLTGDFMLTENQAHLKDYLDSPPLDGPARQTVARAMLQFTPDTNLSALTSIMDDADVAPAVIARLLETFAEISSADSELLLVETVQNVPRERQAEIALELATSREGSATLLKLIEAGKISARHLQSENLLVRLRAGGLPELEERLKTLTKNLPSIKQELRELIQQRKLAYAPANTSPERGKVLFEKHCKNCHRIGDQGELVGPQLDGIGNRGLERLLEDVLDPNQNVDVAFHTMTIVLSDGKVLTGL
ncbi:MAG TPA: c-type cytochrome, partial [Planctomycetaceae bacterium]|nr:c-type cytochrome [Planctomycetaceae bacterium]